MLVSVLLIVRLASAAPALPSPQCLIEGTVTAIAEREHRYDEALRKSWNLPESITYIDISIDVTQARLESPAKGQNCDAAVLKKRPLQLKDPAERDKLKKGACIKALTQFSGDEFRIGQWLWRIEPCAARPR